MNVSIKFQANDREHVKSELKIQQKQMASSWVPYKAPGYFLQGYTTSPVRGDLNPPAERKTALIPL